METFPRNTNSSVRAQSVHRRGSAAPGGCRGLPLFSASSLGGFPSVSKESKILQGPVPHLLRHRLRSQDSDHKMLDGNNRHQGKEAFGGHFIPRSLSRGWDKGPERGWELGGQPVMGEVTEMGPTL